ncbi:MAG: DUF1178 family protein [Limimaricola sp.]|uniref:DUF1178 family protein n=1 Tax=Limimaricola sp. TaxID=2211665 RepID=UPI001DF9CEAE|nr:DUF1178 family protein [Limimaricola sp.]MBI1418980.1 DUF1178 family protein [Limimaricola sp.]
MIRYALKCDRDHRFDSWFASADAYDGLSRAGQLACAVCGSGKVEKAVMAPSVAPETAPQRPLSAPASPAEQALAELRRRVEAEADYVGDSFVTEARAIAGGDAPDRPIWGEARADEARALAAEGIPVAPLPFTPRRRSN